MSGFNRAPQMGQVMQFNSSPASVESERHFFLLGWDGSLSLLTAKSMTPSLGSACCFLHCGRASHLLRAFFVCTSSSMTLAAKPIPRMRVGSCARAFNNPPETRRRMDASLEARGTAADLLTSSHMPWPPFFIGSTHPTTAILIFNVKCWTNSFDPSSRLHSCCTTSSSKDSAPWEFDNRTPKLISALIERRGATRETSWKSIPLA
mmetsp:Transcript_51019/g.94335  ORF Transcript_51019/g.94335 Transcript_51019/m.94335 type:complete len:206 (-) Transcript_51019:170-787(-)